MFGYTDWSRVQKGCRYLLGYALKPIDIQSLFQVVKDAGVIQFTSVT